MYTVILDRQYLGSLFGLERAVFVFLYFPVLTQIVNAKMNPRVVTFQKAI